MLYCHTHFPLDFIHRRYKMKENPVPRDQLRFVWIFDYAFNYNAI